MLDLRMQTQFLDASATAMRACLVAATNAWAASACRSLSVWAELVGGGSQTSMRWHPMDQALWPSLANWMTGPPVPAPADYASYRSTGGHAVAQIAGPETGLDKL